MCRGECQVLSRARVSLTEEQDKQALPPAVMSLEQGADMLNVTKPMTGPRPSECCAGVKTEVSLLWSKENHRKMVGEHTRPVNFLKRSSLLWTEV